MSLFGRRRGKQSTTTATSSKDKPPKVNIVWEVYVDQSKASLDKGGSATLDAFLGLAPASSVKVIPCKLNSSILPSGSATGGGGNTKKPKGPMVRCLSTDGTKCFDVSSVDAVDKVYRILTKHMQCTDVDYESCECLKWKYKGNAHLEAGKFDDAIAAYDKALKKISNRNDPQQEQQEGILLLMRATAYLQRASSHKAQLQQIVSELMKMVPDAAKLKNLYEQTQGTSCPSVCHAMFRRVLADAARQEESFRKTQYWHGLYQYALLQAAQDVLLSTALLPHYSRGWARAGEILSELWKLSESAQYYETAVECDPALASKLEPVIERLRKRQELLESARAYGWSEDTLRLALDVAG